MFFYIGNSSIKIREHGVCLAGKYISLSDVCAYIGLCFLVVVGNGFTVVGFSCVYQYFVFSFTYVLSPTFDKCVGICMCCRRLYGCGVLLLFLTAGEKQYYQKYV